MNHSLPIWNWPKSKSIWPTLIGKTISLLKILTNPMYVPVICTCTCNYDKNAFGHTHASCISLSHLWHLLKPAHVGFFFLCIVFNDFSSWIQYWYSFFFFTNGHLKVLTVNQMWTIPTVQTCVKIKLSKLP